MLDEHEKKEAMGRHARFGGYLKNAVFAANDGVITTFAVVAGVVGASLSSSIVLIIGVASMVADAFSMATGNYLGSKSEKDFYKRHRELKALSPSLGSPSKEATVTFLSFTIAGIIPLISYILYEGDFAFKLSIILTGATLFIIGALRKIFSNRSWIILGLEMLLIGGFAAAIAYGAGYFLKSIVA
jgi:VIT1/CCC1 family predicted Fe2+/Mn2+ transporter